MRKPALVSLVVVVLFATMGAVVIGCTGDYSTAVSDRDAAAPDASVADTSAADAGAPDFDAFPFDVSFPVVDAQIPPDFGPLPVAQPLPPGTRAPVRFLSGGDHEAGGGTSTCSDPPSADGARWCVFYRMPTATTVPATTVPAPSPLGELWVINVSKAGTGEVPVCDGSSADCLRLTSTLWTEFPLAGPGHPYSHEFFGDTLIYYADATSGPHQMHRGPVYAWRPGWSAGRAITSPAGLMCIGHGTTPLFYCLDDVTGDEAKPDSFELRAGSVASLPAAPLPSLGRVHPFRTGGAVAWQASFSPDGQYFALSSPDPDPAVEALRVVATADLGKVAPTQILTGATSWAIGNDSRRLYFQRAEGATEHGLSSADFPTGAAEVKLSGRISDYLILGQGTADQGVSFFTILSQERTAFRLVRDSRTPSSPLTVFTFRDMLEDLHVSNDLRYTAWLDAEFNARVVRHSDLHSCRLNTRAQSAVFEPLFTDSAGLVFWNEDDGTGSDLRIGFYGRPDDCGGTQRFASGLAYYVPLGDRGLVYTDEIDDTNHAALKIAAIKRSGGALGLGPPVRIADGLTEGGFTLLGSPPAMILYKTDREPAGTYVFGPLPL